MDKIKVLIPIPSYGFDPTEVAIPWKLISENNFEVTFATPEGIKGNADIKMLRGINLGIWKSLLRANQDAVNAYCEMNTSKSFSNPLKYEELNAENFDAILLPGGHDKGMKEYLESKILQNLIVDFFSSQKNIAAICHGVVLVSRSINPYTNESVIFNYRTTSLLKSQELTAYNLTKLWLKKYYLTYPDKTVEDEVKDVLSEKSNFINGPFPILRDNLNNLDRGFFVQDRNYLSARWPGDVYSFSLAFIQMIKDSSAK